MQLYSKCFKLQALIKPKRPIMWFRPFILLLFVGDLSFAQSSLTATQINRLADAGKVYGYIKYFHPFLQYKDINWDSAFAVNVQGIIDAKTKQEYAAIL